MSSEWGPDRGVRRGVVAVGAAGVVLIAAGAVVDVFWVVGIGVWAMIGAIVTELVYRPE